MSAKILAADSNAGVRRLLEIRLKKAGCLEAVLPAGDDTIIAGWLGEEIGNNPNA